MFEVPTSVRVGALTHGLQAVAGELTTPVLAPCTDGQLLELVREVEVARRRLASFDQSLIAEITRRGLAPRFGFASVRALLTDMLRVSPAEASARVAAAAVLGPRQALDGTTMEPVLPVAAAAQADGVISAAHARVVADTVHRIPLPLVAEHPDIPARVEADLVGACQVVCVSGGRFVVRGVG